jgi:hypothetical protein
MEEEKTIAQSILTREQKDAQAEIEKEKGKWYRDISKFIATAIVLTSIFEGIENKWISYPLGILAVLLSFRQGTQHFNNYKKYKENGNDNRIQFDHTDGHRRHDQRIPQGEERKTTRTRVETTTNNEKKVTDGNDTGIQSDHTDGNHQLDQPQPQGAGRERNRRRIDEATTNNENRVTEEETCNTIPRQEILNQERDDREEQTTVL